MNLIKNFPLWEMLRSQVTSRQGIEEQVSPSPEIIDNRRLLCLHILQTLRGRLGRGFFVNSGYRCPRVNDAVGGTAFETLHDWLLKATIEKKRLINSVFGSLK